MTLFFYIPVFLQERLALPGEEAAFPYYRIMYLLSVILYVFMPSLIQTGGATYAFHFLHWPMWIPVACLGLVYFGPGKRTPAWVNNVLWTFSIFGIVLFLVL